MPGTPAASSCSHRMPPSKRTEWCGAPGHCGAMFQRIAAEGCDHRTGLALSPVPFGDQATLLAGTLPHAEQIALVHLHPVGAHVDVASLRVAIDEGVARPDVASPIAPVRLQHRKPQ